MKCIFWVIVIGLNCDYFWDFGKNCLSVESFDCEEKTVEGRIYGFLFNKPGEQIENF